MYHYSTNQAARGWLSSPSGGVAGYTAKEEKEGPARTSLVDNEGVTKMPDYLDDLLHTIGNKLDADYRTRAAVDANAERERQTFLQSFSDTRAREIEPVFDEMSERFRGGTSALIFRRVDRREQVWLEVTMKNSPTESVSGQLRYTANLAQKRIFREVQLRGGRANESQPVVGDLTVQQVRRDVAQLLTEMKCALDNG
jgi:hypothetical protein